MRTLTMIPIALVAFLMLYAFWDLKINAFKPPVPVDQLGQSNKAVSLILNEHKLALQSELSSVVLPELEASLEAIKSEYGPLSVEYNQALVEAALMLSASERTDLAQKYMTEAVSVSREVYGTNHRETALNLNDLASLAADASGQEYSINAIGYLREALEIRKIVLDEGHAELIASKINLADQLYLHWRAQGTVENLGLNLDEASTLLEEVLQSYSKQATYADPNNTRSVKMLLARTAFGQKDYAKAADLFAETLPEVSTSTDPLNYVIFSDSYAEYITSLKQTDRENEGEKMRNSMVRFLQVKIEAQQQPISD